MVKGLNGLSAEVERETTQCLDELNVFENEYTVAVGNLNGFTSGLATHDSGSDYSNCITGQANLDRVTNGTNIDSYNSLTASLTAMTRVGSHLESASEHVNRIQSILHKSLPRLVKNI